MYNLYKKVKFSLFIYWISLRWVFRVNVGDIVKYKGKKYVVCNGVRCNSWRLGDLDNGDDGWVRRDECKKVRTLKNLIGSYKSGLSFYFGYWYRSWVYIGHIEGWVKMLNIW